MNIPQKYTDFQIDTLEKLVSIPSPTGYTNRAAKWIAEQLESMGYAPEITNRGNVNCLVGGDCSRGDGLILSAHFDTLGAMVRAIKPNGRLRIARLGGPALGSYEAENCVVITRGGREIEGTLQMNEPSAHVAGGSLTEKKRVPDEMQVVLDIVTSSADETRKAGVENGDIVAFDPRFRRTDGGYIKSRFLDDKAGCSTLLALAKYIKDENVTPKRAVWLVFTCHEEVGTGAANGLPENCTEMIALDMGCVGDDLVCTEREVSICVIDGGGPYDYDMVTAMKEICERENIPHALDMYPYYGSDAGAAVRSCYHLRHGCIGPGVYASHGYERTHRDGLYASLRLCSAYALK